MKIVKKSLLLSLVAAVMTLYPVTVLADTAQPVDPSQSSAVTTTPTDPSSSTPPVPASTPAPTTPTPTPDPTPAPTTPAPAAPTTPPATTPGPTSPTGADAKKYTYNPATGLYENDYYTWNPVTKQTSPKVTPTYSFNPTTGLWDTTKWVYDAPSGKYVPNVVETPATPPTSQQVASPSLSPSALLNGGSGSGINTTGPNSNNNISNTTNNNGTFNLFYNAAISNNISQNAVSGNALLTGNTTAGNATTGDAQNIANLVNLLQSTWSPLANGKLTTFNATIAGNVNGDLVVDPGAINNTGPNSSNSTNGTTNNKLTVTAQGTGSINNNVNLNSQSGNATVAGNTTGGNATSGNATAMANIINAISSSIAAGKSFIGNINITGNLNGDILLPQNVLDSLIASSGPGSTNTTNNTTNNTINANLTNNQNINNNVNATAGTGTATVGDNTTGGNATSGAAQTKVNILNLTGKTVVGKDAILVFVNVLGKWTGLIMNAPAGSTSAALGGGLTSNTGPDSTNTSNNTTNNNVDLTATNNGTINNNVNVNSQSGNADVSHNTKGGNATSGNATSSVNIANLNDSNLSFSDWFGVLFINVFGSWNGSFGVNTSAGDAPAAPASPAVASTSSVSPAIMKFVSKAAGPGASKKVAYAAVSTPPAAETTTSNQPTTPAVLGKSNTNPPAAAAGAVVASHQMTLMWVPFVGSGLGLLILLAEEIYRRRGATAVVNTATAL